MNFLLKSWPRRLAFAVLATLAGYLLWPSLFPSIRAGAGLVLYLLLCIFCIVVLPASAVWLASFAWWFVKPYFRAWHIRHIRNHRLLKEASARGQHTE